MTDLDIMMIGAMVSFLSVAGAYVAIRRRANDTPVRSYQTDDAQYPVAVQATQDVRPR
jgi:hypothetical protein